MKNFQTRGEAKRQRDMKEAELPHCLLIGLAEMAADKKIELLKTNSKGEVVPKTMKLPFLDACGNAIFCGDILTMQNFNGEEYTADYKVIKDPDNNGSEETNGFCLEMIKGNAKAMLNKGLSAFPTGINNNSLRKGTIKK